MNGEGAPGQAERDLAYLRGDLVVGIDFGTAYPGGFYPDISLGDIPRGPATILQFPQVGVQPEPAATGDSDPSVAGDTAVPEPEVAQVIDPELRPQETVYESAPGGIYETNRAPTDWDRVYREYVVLNAPEVGPVFHDSIDWGEVVGGIFGGVLDPFGVGAAAQQAFAPPGVVPQMGSPATVPTGITGVTGGAMQAGCPPTGPKYAKICLATGVVTPLRRRRRRRLLTSSDIKDLSALKSIVGGAALQGAVVQAVRR